MARYLVKCSICNSAEHVVSIRRVIMDANDCMDDWDDPPIAGAFCTECKVEIKFGHIVKVDDDGRLLLVGALQ